MPVWHLTLATDLRLPLLADPFQPREALLRLVEVTREELALFCIVDDHLHAVLMCERDVFERRRRAITRIFRVLSPREVAPSRVRRILDRDHMDSVFEYVLLQPSRHKLPVHPALWEGGCLLDLVDARRLPGLKLRLREVMPRITESDILRVVGLGGAPLVPMDLEGIRRLGARRLLDAAAATLAVDPSLKGHGRREAAARRLACRVGRQAGLPRSELAWMLGAHTRSVTRMRSFSAERDDAPALLRRLALEERIAAAASQRTR
jgi:hypothetical protein